MHFVLVRSYLLHLNKQKQQGEHDTTMDMAGGMKEKMEAILLTNGKTSMENGITLTVTDMLTVGIMHG